MSCSTNISELLAGFSRHGWCSDAFKLEPIPDMGVGAIATRDLEAGETLFRLPIDKILSTYSSDLGTKIDNWDDLADGWTQLILVMMYESSREWAWYLNSMPTTFDTPMFWSDEEKSWLQGTSIQDRIGRQEAEELYHSTIAPIIKAHPDLFPEASLETFHIHGSRILSRSFTMEASTLDADADDEETVAMVPMADMLNAASGLDNAHLEFHDKTCQMVTTKSIKAGDQIYNTYSAPPNAELLRKYGHVDLLPLPGHEWPYGNIEDDVDIDGALVLEAFGNLDDRIDWWMEMGQDDSFIVTLRDGIDSELISFIRVLSSDTDWKRARKTDEPPSGRMEKLDLATLDTLSSILEDRAARYSGTLQDDIVVAQTSTLPRRRMAAIVRVGERRALAKGLAQVADAKSVIEAGPRKKKRV